MRIAKEGIAIFVDKRRMLHDEAYVEGVMYQRYFAYNFLRNLHGSRLMTTCTVIDDNTRLDCNQRVIFIYPEFKPSEEK